MGRAPVAAALGHTVATSAAAPTRLHLLLGTDGAQVVHGGGESALRHVAPVHLRVQNFWSASSGPEYGATSVRGRRAREERGVCTKRVIATQIDWPSLPRSSTPSMAARVGVVQPSARPTEATPSSKT